MVPSKQKLETGLYLGPRSQGNPETERSP